MRNVLMVAGATVALGLMVAAPAATATSSITDHKVGICHATGSKTNPYVFIVVDEHAVKAHEHHQDGRDIIGVKSAKDCPKGSTATPKPSVSPSPKPSTSPSVSPKPGQGGGQTLGTSIELPARLPDTGATDLTVLLGVPALAGATAAYLRSRSKR